MLCSTRNAGRSSVRWSWAGAGAGAWRDCGGMTARVSTVLAMTDWLQKGAKCVTMMPGVFEDDLLGDLLNSFGCHSLYSIHPQTD